MSRVSIHDAGRFNRQLTVENRLEVPDGFGGYLTDVQPVGTVWASVCPVNAGQKTRAENLALEISHTIILRYRHDISTTTRFVTGTRKFEVRAVHDVDETRRYLECECVERR